MCKIRAVRVRSRPLPIYLGNRYIQIDSVFQKDAHHERHEHGKCSISKFRKLYFHRAKLYAPANVRGRRWRFEADLRGWR